MNIFLTKTSYFYQQPFKTGIVVSALLSAFTAKPGTWLALPPLTPYV